MSTKNVTLHDENGNILLPATKTSRVTDANGTNLDTLLQQAGHVKSISVNGTAQTIDANGNVDIDAVTDDMIEDVAHWGDTVSNVTTVDFNAQTDTVWNKAQVLSAAQQAQARTNISAQEALVSGTNIKTINNESILGSGNITISGGGGSGGGNVSSTTINTIVTLTEAQYTALSTKDSSTLYIITA